MTSFETIKEMLKSRIKTPADLADFKRKAAKKYRIPIPSNIQLLKSYHNLLENKIIKKSKIIEEILKTRPVRSLSGIVNVSVLTKPYPCPGKCLYCPTEKGIPKSYLSGEPAVERAKQLNYDPYLQVKKRLEMLEAEGHPTDKVDLRLIGGTWSFYPKNYQTWFIKRCFQACNEFGNSKIFNFQFSIFNKFSNPNFQTLKKEQRKNEKTKCRIIGISIETRPDFVDKEEIKRLRRLGVTRVELGVQSIYDDVLKLIERGQGKKETILATKLLKNAGFKICYQMMPNLSGSNLKRDEKMFAELFKNPDFQPDYLKIYPCAVLKSAPLYKWWEQGKYKPYSKEKLLGLIKKIKKKIPYYVRIQRITRDIPSPLVAAGGAKISNLRQIIQKVIKQEGWKCKCVRCREIRGEYNQKEKVYFFREDYEASEDKEIFLSIENKEREKLYSLLRLRIPSFAPKTVENCSRPFSPVLRGAAIIREIQTFGEVAQIGATRHNFAGVDGLRVGPQHRGFGKKLLKEAERITQKEFGLNKIAVISGVGAREYFRKLGYKLKDTYMVKKI